MGLSGRRWSIALACLVVAVLCVGVSLLPHTDDGCPTEIHCTVCLTHMAGVAVEVAVPSLAFVLAPGIAAPEPQTSPGNIGAPSTLALRGPPIA